MKTYLNISIKNYFDIMFYILKQAKISKEF